MSDEGQRGNCELKSYRVHSRTGTTGVAPDWGEHCHFTTNKASHGTQGAPGSGGHLPLGYRTTQGVPEVCSGLCCNSQSSTQHTSSQRNPSQETLSVAVHMIPEPLSAPVCKRKRSFQVTNISNDITLSIVAMLHRLEFIRVLGRASSRQSSKDFMSMSHGERWTHHWVPETKLGPFVRVQAPWFPDSCWTLLKA